MCGGSNNGVVQDIADYISNSHVSPCNAASFGCYVYMALTPAITGCYGGWIDSSITKPIEDWLVGAIGSALGVTVGEACSHYEKSGNVF